MARTIEALGMNRIRLAITAVLTVGLLTMSPLSAQAQTASSAPASPAQAASASPSPAQAPGAPQPSTAAGSAQASGQPAASGPAGVATPVGSNPPQEKPEGLPILAYLLIILAGVWFLAAIAGIIRLLARPTTGPYAVPLPPSETDRHFLSFVMPFGAIVTVGIILVAFGSLFLWLASISPKAFDTEIYPLAVDLFIVCFVMLVATVLALRGGGQPRTEVH